MKNLKLQLSILIAFILFISCKSDIKFDRRGWTMKGDLNGFPKRERMLNDLMKNYKIKGLKYSELVNLLGEPEIETTSESSSANYNIVTEYGTDIDPIYIKELVISLSIDSIAQNCIVTNWGKR